MIRLELPFPPSVNRMYANGGNKRGRHKTPVYKAWFQEASYRIKDNRKRDLDNLIKPINDLLQSNKVIQNDHYCERITMSWNSAIDSGCVVIVQPFEGGIE